MNKLFGILGLGIVAGAVAYMLLNKDKNDERGCTDDTSPKSETQNSSDTKYSKSETIYNERTEFENAKASATGTMYTRHKEASDIIREAVSNICTNSEVFEKEDRDLDTLSEELENLLDEEARE